MIRIIKGTFGMNKDGAIVGITKDDGPISIDPEREEELIRLGIAEKVEQSGEEFEVTEDYLKSLKMTELKEFSARIGIKFKAGTNKEDFIREILNAVDEEAAGDVTIEENGDDHTPDFDPEEAIQ